MKHLSYVLLCLLSFCLWSCERPSPTPSLDDHPNKNEEGVKEAFYKFNDAFAKADLESLRSMLTDDYQHTNGTSLPIGKDEWLSYIDRRRQDLISGKLGVRSYVANQLKVSMYENAALITGRISVVESRGGEFKTRSYRITNLWVWEEDRWKRAGFHDGEIK